jgi:hypothetical protein
MISSIGEDIQQEELSNSVDGNVSPHSILNVLISYKLAILLLSRYCLEICTYEH